MTPHEPSSVIIARGPIAAERALLDQIDRLTPRRPEDLGFPVRVIVPSASLRLHLLSRLLRHRGRAIAGVTVQTLHGAAAEVLERCNDTAVIGDLAFQVLVRRAASRNPVLRSALETLEKGYDVVEAAVRDLLDAGYGPDHLEAVLDKLEDLRGTVAHHRLRRVRALARITARLAKELGKLGVRRLEQCPQEAAELLRDRGMAALPSRAVLVHGFADATGVATDFLHALLITLDGTLVLDRPPDPAASDRDDAGCVFLERFEIHFGGLARETLDEEPETAAVDAIEALTLEVEVRHVAGRIRHLLDAGAEPETIGLVARDLELITSPLRRHFQRLGIPHSGVGCTVPGGSAWRRARRLAALLRAGGSVSIELWLEACVDHSGTTEALLALRTLGMVRVDELARLRGGRVLEHGVRLPLPTLDENGEPGAARLLPPDELRALVTRAAELVEVFRAWPKRAKLTTHRRRLQRVMQALGWTEEDENSRLLADAVAGMIDQSPVELRLRRDEWFDVVVRRLEELGNAPVGGAGGGVQLLSAMEARGRSFEHLFVLGMNRGTFPRIVQEDALLPDTVRGHLAAEVLPEFPVKARGLDEERYLFAQLLSAAPRVTLSWRSSDEGTRVARSPFVERLRRERGLEAARAVSPWSPSADELDEHAHPRSAFEHAVSASAPESRASMPPLLAEAATEGRRRARLNPPPAEWADARIEILDRIDPSSPATGPGPWAGLVGERSRPGDRLPPVTGIEGLARCPWRELLVRRLGMSPMPDPRLGLPDTSGPLVGLLVHEVLQRIVDRATDRQGLSLEAAHGGVAIEVGWPEADEFGEIVSVAAEKLARREGIAALGMARLLAAQAGPYLEVARRSEWGDDGVLACAVAAEISGELRVEGVAEALRFRADRVDRAADGLDLLDYKTSRPPITAITESKRHEKLCDNVAHGRLLQGVAYALVSGGGSGSYLYLAPDLGASPESVRSIVVDADDSEVTALFHASTATVAEAWRVGAMFPRVEDPKGEARHCEYCPVAEACLRSDSDYRRRITDWAVAGKGPSSPVEDAGRRLWWIGEGQHGDGS